MSAKLKNAIRAVNRTALMLGSVSTLAVSGATFAQEEGALMEEIEVTGIRGSLKSAIDTKRNSTSIVDSISAEDVGKFPDKNVAESLSRIPGVAVSREFGEGEQITIRGAAPNLNRTQLNGQSVGTADWFILDNPSRSFNYTLLPSVLISKLDVIKSPSASDDEGSVGGTVNVETRRPLDMDAHSTSISIEAGYSEKSEEWDPSIAAQYSWKNDSETFGVLVAAVKQDRTVVREGVEFLGWDTPESASDRGYFAPTQPMGTPRFEQDRERETLFLSLQSAPTDELTMTFNALNSKMDANNQNANWLVWPNYDEDSATITDGVLTAGSSDNSRVAVNWINRVSSTETQSYNFDVEYASDAFSLSGALGYTKGEGGTERETSWEYNGARTDLLATQTSFDIANPTLNSNPQPNSPSEFAAGWIWGGEKPTTDEETYFQVDLELPVEAGAFTAIKTGLKVRQAERTQDRIAYSWHAPNNANGDLPDGTPHYLAHIFNECPTLADCGLADQGLLTIDAPVAGNMSEVIDQNRGVMEDIAFNGLNGVTADYARHQNLAEIWTVEEDITALYVQGDFEGDNYRGNVGIRYVDTKQTSGGYEYSSDSWGLNTLDREWLAPSYLAWVEEENDYGEFLPSVNLILDLNDDMVLRTAAARVMARQDWSDISAYETYGALNVPDPKGTAGNPQMRPHIYNQFDLSYEWYYSDASMFGAAYFLKQADSYRVTSTYTEARYDDANDVNVDVDFAVPQNGDGGVTDGLELQWQHAFDSGWGVQANYTYTDARENDPERNGLTPGVSRHMSNLAGYFENDIFSARLLYNYRTEWYKGIHFNGNDLFNDSFGQWDATFSWNVTENIALTAEALNLNDEQVVEYANNDKSQTMSIYENGRRFVLGARFNF